MAGTASLLDSAAIISVSAALPLWRSTFGLSDLMVGVVTGFMTLSIAVGALVGGRLSDRGSRTRVFSTSLLAYAVGAAAVAAADQTWQIVAGVVVLGAASGADLPASIGLIADRAPRHARARMIAATQVMWTLGVLLASALAFLVAPFGTSGMRWAFCGLSVMALGSVIARRDLLPFTARPESGQTSDELALSSPATGPEPSGAVQVHGTPAGHLRQIVLVGAFYVMFTLVASTFANFRTYVLVVANEMTQTMATAVGFGATLIGLGGTVVFSAVADTRWRARSYPVGGILLVTAPLMLAATRAERAEWTIAALVVFSLAHPFVGDALYKVWSQERIPAETRATAQGGTIAFARIAAAAFALATPTLLSRSPSALFALVTLFSLGAVMVGLRVSRSI